MLKRIASDVIVITIYSFKNISHFHLMVPSHWLIKFERLIFESGLWSFRSSLRYTASNTILNLGSRAFGHMFAAIGFMGEQLK